MGVEDIVPITEGKLRAFMYEIYQKGKQSELNRIVRLLEQADSACSPWAIDLISEDTGNIPKRFRDISNGE